MNMTEYPLATQILLWVVVGGLLLTQSTLIFISARKRGVNAWFWGLVGLLNIPSGAILYYFFVIFPTRRKRRK